MSGAILFLTWETFRVYVILVAQYFAGGLIIARLLNPRVPKIQARSTRPELIRRDVRQSMLSLLSISAFIAGGTLLYNHGFGFRAPTSLAGTAASFVGSMLLFDTWFYWGHRLVHTRMLYRLAHKFHHVAVTPTTWTTNSETFLDNCFMQSYFFFAHFLVPVAPYTLLVHKIYDQFTGMLGHSGYEHARGPFAAFPSPFVGVTYHDQHHELFNCNYSDHFSIWDRLMGTIHPNYDRIITR